MNFFKTTALVAATCLLFACHNLDQKSENGQTAVNVNPAALPESTRPEDEKALITGPPDSANFQPGQQEQRRKQKQKPGPAPGKDDWDKKIIKTAILDLEVKDYHVYSVSLRDKVRALGGYVAQEEQSQSDYKIQNSVTVKVPVDQFDLAVTQLTNGTEKINERKVTSQDVTAEVVDMRSRIEAKRQVRSRYMDLLNQAKNMEDILRVQSVINEVQEQIESATGRVEYLGHASVFSTIHLTFYQVLNATAPETDKPTFGLKISEAFKNGSNWFGDVFVGLVSVWPLFLIIITAIIIYKRSNIRKPKQA